MNSKVIKQNLKQNIIIKHFFIQIKTKKIIKNANLQFYFMYFVKKTHNKLNNSIEKQNVCHC